MKMFEIIKPVTIASATDNHGNVNRTKANKMVDPRGYFAKNKRLSKKKSQNSPVR